jgi:phospholipid/cholesterol/gamma-HCH transport system ATP-binding protein
VAHGLNRPTGVPDAIEFIDVHKAFGRNQILRGPEHGDPRREDLDDPRPVGTGKSVCIKHMVGLLYPDEGDVIVHGESVPNMHDDELFEMRKKFGVLFQDGALFGSMNLFDNVCFPLRQHTDKSEEEIGAIVSRRLREVGLDARARHMPNELSGGMRKRARRSRGRSCSIRTSCCSTSPTRASIRCGPRCSASSSRRSTRRTAAPTW